MTSLVFFVFLSLTRSKSNVYDDDEEDGNSYGYKNFLGYYAEFDENQQNYEYDYDEPDQAAEGLLEKFDHLQTKEQKYQYIKQLLLELAQNVDNSATRNEIEYGIGGEINSILNSVDLKDRETKQQFLGLQIGIDQLRLDIDQLVNSTRIELQKILKISRKEILNSLKEIVAKSIEQNNVVAKDVNAHVGKSVSEYKNISIKKAILYFTGFQVLLFICVYLYSKYIKEIRVG